MELSLNANAFEESTREIAMALQKPLDLISQDLSKDYGGPMEHLWIDFELLERDVSRRPPWAFRFQKKVGGVSPDKLTGLPRGTYMNVGHYSVRPDFAELRDVPIESIPSYVLGLIYASTSVLIEKQQKLKGFDAEQFRADFLVSCASYGYEIQQDRGAT
jgi:hypothetical protein